LAATLHYDGWTASCSCYIHTTLHVFEGLLTSYFARREVFTAMKIQVMVFWVVTPFKLWYNT